MKVLAILLGICAVLGLLCCGGFLWLSPSLKPSINTSRSSGLSYDALKGVDQAYADRMASYEQELEKWKSAKEERDTIQADIEQLTIQLSVMERDKPAPPEFELRVWSTVSKEYTTTAVLIDTDGVTATLRKTDDTTVTVPKARLIADSRVYIEQAQEDLLTHADALTSWKSKMQRLENTLSAATERIALANSPPPNEPNRQEMIDEIKKQNRLQRIAEYEAKAEERAHQKELATADAKASAEQKKREAEAIERERIPGLAPVDIYLNFTNKGFILTKDIHPIQSEWICSDEKPYGQMRVTTLGDSASTVTGIKATYMSFERPINDARAAEFFGYVASAPFDGSNPAQARAWVKENIGKRASIEYGSVVIELYAYNELVRTLTILRKQN